jgi:CO/xanthine dehydrogenase Mo-binding subunit
VGLAVSWYSPQTLATLLSKAAGGAPVKGVPPVNKNSINCPLARVCSDTHKTGVNLDGKINAVQAVYDWDSGAYADYGVNVG